MSIAPNHCVEPNPLAPGEDVRDAIRNLAPE